jgi:hypothetical protein
MAIKLYTAIAGIPFLTKSLLSIDVFNLHYGLSDSSEIDDDNDLDFDIRKERVVSCDSDLTDINLPVIEITKHRRKWLRKRVRWLLSCTQTALKKQSPFAGIPFLTKSLLSINVFNLLLCDLLTSCRCLFSS